MDRCRACVQTVRLYRITVAVCVSAFVGVLVFVLAPPPNPCAGYEDNAPVVSPVDDRVHASPWNFTNRLHFAGDALVPRPLEIGLCSTEMIVARGESRPPIHCPAHGFGFRPTPLTLFEGVLFNTELDMLEAHLEESYPAVDAFVVVESAYTFQGHAKPLVFQNNLRRYAKFRDKLVHTVLPSRHDNEFQQERDMRNAIAATLTALNVSRSSVLIIADADEITSLEQLWVVKFCDVPTEGTFRLKFFYYSLHWRHSNNWFAVHWMPLSLITADRHPDMLRFSFAGTYPFILPDAGWHCSYFGDEAFIANKLHSFAPGTDAYKGPPYDQPGYIRCVIRRGMDLFLRSNEQLLYVKDVDGPWAFHGVPWLRKAFLLW